MRSKRTETCSSNTKDNSSPLSQSHQRNLLASFSEDLQSLTGCLPDGSLQSSFCVDVEASYLSAPTAANLNLNRRCPADHSCPRKEVLAAQNEATGHVWVWTSWRPESREAVTGISGGRRRPTAWVEGGLPYPQPSRPGFRSLELSRQDLSPGILTALPHH